MPNIRVDRANESDDFISICIHILLSFDYCDGATNSHAGRVVLQNQA